MQSPLGQPSQPPHQTDTFESNYSSQSSFHGCVFRGRRWLWGLAILLLMVIAAGLILAAHHYYVSFGGQGYLKYRNIDAPENSIPIACLPLRRSWSIGNETQTNSGPMEVPYYVCGDQASSCEAYNQPDICCPVKTSCHPTTTTNSNVYCCNANETDLACEISLHALPKCLYGYFECLAEEGGGCCPIDSLCSVNGCTKSIAPQIIGGTTGAIDSTGPITITAIAAVTSTIAKQGEVAQSSAKNSMVTRMCLPHSCMSFLILVVALMGFL